MQRLPPMLHRKRTARRDDSFRAGPNGFMSFDTLGLSDKVVSAVKAVGYTTPTPIQSQAIPRVLERRDVLGLAQTGTGKTAGFVLPMLTLLEHGRARARMPRTLILEPTRELASQVQDSFARYGANHKLNLALLIGGVSFDDQDKIITRGADVLIATPGRLLDHFERGRLLLTGVEILVIDEADRMLDMGFIPDIERIVKLLPFTRQTLFFSATMPPEITQLADRFLHNPVRVEVSKSASVVETITHKLVPSGGAPHEKRDTLRGLIDGAPDLTNAIIFCNRKRDVATLHRSLERHGYSVGALHGDMDQHSRLRTLDSFRDGKIKLLVASDVAARGLDIPAVSHIFNFDVPTHSEDYVHRIGRTGRAGRSGAALTIVTKPETKYIHLIEKLIGKDIEWVTAPDVVHAAASGSDGHVRHHRDRAERGGNRRRREGRGERQHSEPTRTERPVQANERPAAAAAQQQASKAATPRREGEADQGRAVGFSDHVPAFLLRPVRIPSRPEALEEV
jgi:superfamily II DNA/RNA helicase